MPLGADGMLGSPWRPGSRTAFGEWLEPDRGRRAPSEVFHFKVCEPRMMPAQSCISMPYWGYEVRTQTQEPGWRRHSTALHRYSDFMWLRENLVAQHPGVIVPPLPEQSLQGVWEKVVIMNQDLLDHRQRALTKFLSGLGSHAVLQRSSLLKGFCEQEGIAWRTFQSAHKREQEDQAEKLSLLQVLARRSREGWFRVMGSSDPCPSNAPSPASRRGSTGFDVLQERKLQSAESSRTFEIISDAFEAQVNARKELARALEELSRAEQGVAWCTRSGVGRRRRVREGGERGPGR
eukprot:TRINITY_DN13871_c0_g1_i4.p1 TRINITY_DN13871_c0_g1~~TRINITY_DN13871_c0_g1_i4.p1  ORF type:complete len:292 (+),score=58.04 TRINITY_DN13871_c0_g1_i4:38-913(+)